MTDTGLKSKAMVDLTVGQVMRIRSSWLARGMSAQARMQELVDATFMAVDALKIPRPDVIYDPALAGTTTCGVYSINDWRLELNATFATDETLASMGPDLALRECLDTVYHETRHHEQAFRARYYLLTLGKSFAHFKQMLQNTNNNIKNGFAQKPVPNTMAELYGIPLKFTQAFWDMFRGRFQYTGAELTEAKAWYEETFGSLGSERGAIMTALGKPNRRASIYDLYRTIVMEDDGWSTGYLCGDTYLTRAFQERKATIDKNIQTLEGRISELKSLNVRRRGALDKGISQFRAEGGQALLNKLKQLGAAVKSDDQKIDRLEVALNSQRSTLAKDKLDTGKLVRKHRESMTEHRLKAYDSRQRRGYDKGTSEQR